MNDSEHFQKLCQSQIDGTATDAESQELAGLLNASEEARHAYVQQMRVHALLTWQHGRSGAEAPVLAEASKIIHIPWKRRILSLAALLVLSAIVWWSFPTAPTVGFEVMATTGTSFRVGERAKRGMIELEKGQLTFRLESGAVVDIDGPVKVQLIDSMHLRVFKGTVTADISEGQKGFVVETAETRVVDLGTRFSVAADNEKGTDVVVFEGEVEVYDSSGKVTAERPKITLIEGEAIRVPNKKSPDRLRMVSMRPADAKMKEQGLASEIVTDIDDNVPGGDFRGYYGLVPRRFGEGARTYTTGHTRTWHALVGQTFPEELLGADGICTFDIDRMQPDLQITLQVSKPCTVYVMTDARVGPPEWLKKDFIETEHKLRSGPWMPRKTPKEDYPKVYADPSKYVPYIVWKRRIDAPGAVVLGPALSTSKAMYGIAVKALP